MPTLQSSPASLLLLALCTLPPLALGAGPAATEPAGTVHLVIQDHSFQPAEIHFAAGRPLVIEVENRDDAVEEFESYDLDREQRVKPGKTDHVTLGPLGKGRYEFFGDFHRKTARGVLVVE